MLVSDVLQRSNSNGVSGGSLSTSEALDLQCADDGADLALDALLEGRLPDPDPTRHHFILYDVDNSHCQARSNCGSSSSDSESEGGRSSSFTADTGHFDSSAARPSGSSQAKGLNALLELPSLPQTAQRTY